MIRTLTALAGVAVVASAANAAFVGGVFRANESATTAARATDAGTVTVFDLYLGFDESDDILINIGNAEVSTGGANLFQQDLFGSNVNTSAQQNSGAWGAIPALEFDTYVSIGGSPDASGVGSDNSTTTTDPDFAFQADGFVGGWFSTPFAGTDPPEFPGATPNTANPDTGLFEVFTGRFTVEGDFLDARGLFVGDAGDGFIFSDVFSGLLDVNWVDSAGEELVNDAEVIVGVPAPGAVALLGLGGLAATRRRR